MGTQEQAIRRLVIDVGHAKRALDRLIIEARELGMSWEEIRQAFGYSHRSGAQRRYSAAVARLRDDPGIRDTPLPSLSPPERAKPVKSQRVQPKRHTRKKRR